MPKKQDDIIQPIDADFDDVAHAASVVLPKKCNFTLKATHGSPEKLLKVGNVEIECYVLENGTRVFSGNGMKSALGMSNAKVAKMADLVGQEWLKPFITKELAKAAEMPILFTRPGRGGKQAYAFEAILLIDMANAILHAERAGKIPKSNVLFYEKVCIQAHAIISSFAKTGIIAVIDEITGYQANRANDALQRILDKYLLKEYAAWAKRFPDAFYQEIYRLKGWKWEGRTKNTKPIVGKYTNNVVYQRLAPGILEELRRKNPPNSKGRRRVNRHQWLTEEIGHAALQQHLYAVMVIMKLSSSWGNFERSLQKVFPVLNSNLELDIE